MTITNNDLIVVNIANLLNLLGALFIIINIIILSLKSNKITIHRANLFMVSIVNLCLSIGTTIFSSIYFNNNDSYLWYNIFFLIINKKKKQNTRIIY
jgi:hypothetical protein